MDTVSHSIPVAVLLLALLGVAACGDSETVSRGPGAEGVAGVYRVDGGEASREFLRAMRALEDEIDAERRADPEKGVRLSQEAREVWGEATREWAAEYASIFRLELNKAGQGSVAVPRAGEDEPLVTQIVWSRSGQGIQLQPDRLSANSDYSVERTEDGLRLLLWRVVIPWPPSGGKYGREILVNLTLHKQ